MTTDRSNLSDQIQKTHDLRVAAQERLAEKLVNDPVARAEDARRKARDKLREQNQWKASIAGRAGKQYHIPVEIEGFSTNEADALNSLAVKINTAFPAENTGRVAEIIRDLSGRSDSEPDFVASRELLISAHLDDSKIFKASEQILDVLGTRRAQKLAKKLEQIAEEEAEED